MRSEESQAQRHANKNGRDLRSDDDIYTVSNKKKLRLHFPLACNTIHEFDLYFPELG